MGRSGHTRELPRRTNGLVVAWLNGSRPKHLPERDGPGQRSRVYRRRLVVPIHLPREENLVYPAGYSGPQEPRNRGYSTQMVLPLPHRSTGLRAAKVQRRLEADLDRQLSVY